MKQPLRFRISNWYQLINAKSNTSSKLSITVSDFIKNERLQGTRISVIHKDYGVLFAHVINGKGTLVEEFDDSMVFELPVDYILAELDKYGFKIEYKPIENLPIGQIEYLITLRDLGYDKIRILRVYEYVNGLKDYKFKVVGFQIKEHPNWIDNGYVASKKEFEAGVIAGSVINLSLISKTKNYNWTSIEPFVANIDDIIEENSF